MAIKETTNISLRLMIPLIGLSFWTGTTFMMVLKLQERQTIIEEGIKKDGEQSYNRDRAINDKLAEVKNEVSVMNGNIEVIIMNFEKRKKWR